VSSSKSNLQGVNSSQTSAIEIKSDTEIDKLRVAGQAVAKILKKLSEHLRPGISTAQLDDIAFKEISSLGMKPAFLGYRGFPASACISINSELVHGIPRSNRIIKDGDIVTVDLGVLCNGYFGDAAATYGVGRVTKEAEKLMEVTKESLERAIEAVKPGNRLGDVSWAVQEFAEKNGYSVVRDYVGHGIGRKLHEEPAVPNFGKPNTGPRFVPGVVLAIEPMINVGSWRVKQLSDGWTVVTEDGKLCAHFEHMVAVTKSGNEVLTRV
jgi:methionyl aminopeptidase